MDCGGTLGGPPCRELHRSGRKVKSAHARSRLRADEPPARSTEARPRSGQPDFLLYRMACSADRIPNGEVEPQVRRRRIGLSTRNARDDWERGSARCKMEKISAGKFHF